VHQLVALKSIEDGSLRKWTNNDHMELAYKANPSSVTTDEVAPKACLMGWLVLDERPRRRIGLPDTFSNAS
jgi:hypothetical protein